MPNERQLRASEPRGDVGVGSHKGRGKPENGLPFTYQGGCHKQRKGQTMNLKRRFEQCYKAMGGNQRLGPTPGSLAAANCPAY